MFIMKLHVSPINGTVSAASHEAGQLLNTIPLTYHLGAVRSALGGDREALPLPALGGSDEIAIMLPHGFSSASLGPPPNKPPLMLGQHRP